MKISDLRARINSYIVLVFLVLMTALFFRLKFICLLSINA